MWHWSGHMSGWWWAMVPLMLAFWALLIWGFVVLVRSDSGRRRDTESADDILAERLARGEIDETEYRRRREAIHA